jgi:hypothetical protein
MKKVLPVLALTIALSGCFGETTVDTSSVDTLNGSVRDIAEDLPLAEKLRFEAAIQTLVEANRGEDRSLPEIVAALKPQIGGKNAAEVIAVADAWTKAEEKRVADLERKQTLDDLHGKISEYTSEITRLEKVIVEQNANSEKVLGEFSVANQVYFWRGSSGRQYPVLDMEVTNNHSKAVETVVFRGVLRAAGKAEVLVDRQMRYEFGARLKPGETKKIRFEPNEYGEWAKAELEKRDDLELSVDIINLSYPDGTELIRTYVFRGDDPVLKVENLKRRLNDAKTRLNALMAGAEPTQKGS